MNIREIRSWMYTRFAPNNKDYKTEFVVGVQEFIDYARMLPQYEKNGGMSCPCKKCKNRKFFKKDDVHVHLLRWGFVADYWYWTQHGEHEPSKMNVHGGASSSAQVEISAIPNPYENPNVSDFGLGSEFDIDSNHDDLLNFEVPHFHNMFNVAQQQLWPGCTHSKLSMAVEMMSIKYDYNISRECFDRWAQLMSSTSHVENCGLWPGCTKTHSKLSIVVQMMSIKSDYNISRECFDRWAQLMSSTSQVENCVPNNFSEVKKLLKGLGLTSIKIDCCINGCMLYYKNDDQLIECKFCQHRRFKPCQKRRQMKPVPYKRMYYLPLIPRLKRLYTSSKSAEHMRWHSENRREPGVLCHPSDGLAWKHFDKIHTHFASEPRNVRLGLYANGFKPYNQSTTHYSYWPVILTPYNLPPEMCMTTPYLFLTCLIPGPYNPKNQIDVYIQPLVDELKQLWDEGVEAYDISMKQNFIMRAALMWTINDFSAFGMLSGWMTAGKLACPVCMEQQKSFRLKYGGKLSWFDCHRQFLPKDHIFRENRDAFIVGRTENSEPPIRKTGEQIWEEVSSLSKITNLQPEHANLQGYGVSHNWTKQSIFWELPYWKDNLIRHNLDAMQIENNIFDSIFNTVMDIKGKTIDNEKARMDLSEYCRRPGLHLKTLPNGKVVKPKACFTLTNDEKEEVYTWVKNLSMPDGYASNLARCIDKSSQKLHGMKSHDCHLFMQQLLPFAFMNSLPPAVYKVFTELSHFFRNLCCTELRVDDLYQMEKNISVILCKLELIFPPGFFDVMKHLSVHLPYEALVCGPVRYRWIHPFKRFLHGLKGKVKNRVQVEDSICEAYIAKEIAYFSSYYFESHIQSKSTGSTKHNDQTPCTFSVFNQHGHHVDQCTTRWLTDEEYKAASLHVLTQCDEVIPLIECYKSVVRHYLPGINDNDVELSFENNFVKWFKDYVHNPRNMVNNQFLRDLAWGPNRKVLTWSRFFVNGYIFHTESWEMNKQTCNSGVCIKGEGSTKFYGKLKEVLQLSYPKLPEKRVVLFNCDWFDSLSNRGIRVEEQYGHIEIKQSERCPKFNPFILASHASQVYYVPYPGRRHDQIDWQFVIKTRPYNRVETYTIDDAFQESHTIDSSVVDADVIENLVHSNGSYEEVDTNQFGVEECQEFEELQSDEEEYEDDEGSEEDENDEGSKEDEDDEDETEDEEGEDDNE